MTRKMSVIFTFLIPFPALSYQLKCYRTQDAIAGLRSETSPKYAIMLFYPCLSLSNER